MYNKCPLLSITSFCFSALPASTLLRFGPILVNLSYAVTSVINGDLYFRSLDLKGRYYAEFIFSKPLQIITFKGLKKNDG